MTTNLVRLCITLLTTCLLLAACAGGAIPVATAIPEAVYEPEPEPEVVYVPALDPVPAPELVLVCLPEFEPQPEPEHVYVEEQEPGFVYAVDQPPEPEYAVDSPPILTPQVMPMLEEPPHPIVAFTEMIGSHAYMGAYVHYSERRIIPMLGRRDAIVAALAAFDADTSDIVILPEPVGVAYSRAQQEAAWYYLGENMDRFNLWAIGFGKDRLVVTMHEGATQADRQAIIDAVQITLIEFEEGSAQAFVDSMFGERVEAPYPAHS